MPVRWYHDLYEGERAGEKRYSIISRLRRRKLLARGYVITPPSNGNNVLDIYPAKTFLLPCFRDKEIFAVGIAADYDEALEVAGKIVADMYREIGRPDIEEFLAKRERKEGKALRRQK